VDVAAPGQPGIHHSPPRADSVSEKQADPGRIFGAGDGGCRVEWT
jgi:hypothetical protein